MRTTAELASMSCEELKNYEQSLITLWTPRMALESVMKAIHQKHSWSFNKNDSSKKLVNSCLTHSLIPQYLQTQFCSISTLLESGAATIRNKEGGHGQATEVKEVPEYLASYALHLTASNLLFLIKCEEDYSK